MSSFSLKNKYAKNEENIICELIIDVEIEGFIFCIENMYRKIAHTENSPAKNPFFKDSTLNLNCVISFFMKCM